MTALPQDVVADLRHRVAELEQRLQSSLGERDQAVAQQAAGAVENARILTELRTAQERQAASAEILRAIASMPGDAERPLQQIAETTARLFGASSVTLGIASGDEWGRMIRVGPSSQRVGSEVPAADLRIGARNLPGTVFRENRQIHIPDLDNLDLAIADWPALPHARAAGARAMAGTPLRREGKAVGALVVHRDRPAPFSDEELALLQSFADQAVIAIENARLFNETKEALARQTATAEILRVISQSPTDVRPVFDAIVLTAVRLIGCDLGFVLRCDGTTYSPAAAATPEGPMADLGPANLPIDPSINFPSRAIVDKKMLHLPDWSVIDLPEHERNIRNMFGVNSALYLPLLRGEECIGLLALAGKRPGIFGESEIALAESFRDQALIAIENTRLFNETQEALEQQKASADILSVISSSVADTQPVFDKILHSIEHLFGGEERFIFLVGEDGLLHIGAAHGRTAERARALFPAPLKGTASEVAIRERRLVISADIFNDPDIPADARERSRRFGTNYSMVVAPMLSEDRAIGSILVARTSMEPFSEKECSLLGAFADQAVIAIQNARLFNETREALERQTATADILKVIASSPSDVQPVFEAIAASANRLIGGYSTSVFSFVDDTQHLSAFTPTSPAADAALKASFPRPLSAQPWAEQTRNGEIVHVPDIETDSAVPANLRDVWRMRGFRGLLLVPLRRDRASIGMISVTRKEPGAFAAHHVQLLQTFADQAVIAIENVRLFNETKEALERQTATADILKVIASSPSDVQPVFDAIATTANRLIGGFSTAVFRFVDGMTHLAAFTSTHPAADEVLKASFPRRLADFPPFEWVREGEAAQIADAETLPDDVRHIARARGFRSVLFAPLMSQGTPIGLISVTRVQPGSFADHHVQLLQTFADQAVIAIENVRLFEEVQARTEDLRESLQQQTATADVLKVISRSAFDLQTVLDTLTESAARLCNADMAAIARQDARGFYHATNYNFSVDWVRVTDAFRFQPERGSVIGRVLLAGAAVQIPDVLADPEYAYSDMQKAAGYRTILGVPLLRGKEPIGVLFLGHRTVEPFTEKQVELVSTFADQAVIAIENVRLFEEVQAKTRELEEALTYQTGSSNILSVIASSPTDVGPVLKAIVESACELCEAYDAVVLLRDGDHLRFNEHHGPIPIGSEKWPINRNWVAGRSVVDKTPIQVHDLLSEGAEFPEGQEMSRAQGHRTVLSVPMLREGESIGAIALRRTEVQPFSDKQIALLQTFSDQAVIAIGNVRLFEEVQAKTRDLTEALTYQTGSSNILSVIASSPTDVGPVLKAIVESACELCEAYDATVALKDGDDLRFSAHHGPIPISHEKWPINRNWTAGRAFLDQRPVHVGDLQSDEDFPEGRELSLRMGHRSILSVPLLREGESIGAIVLRRTEVQPFSDKQIALLQTFADQAVIAIGNVRLFEEVQAKTRDLSEALTYQTGSGNILRVIASSPTDVGPVLNAIVESASELCEAYDAVVLLKDGEDLRFSAHNGPIPINIEKWPIGRNWTAGRAFLDRRPVHVHDLLSDEGADFPDGRELSRIAGLPGSVRTILSVPLLREKESIGAILLRRTDVQPFSEKQIALLQTFADQAVIAIGNVRLFDEVQAKTRDLTESLQQQTATADVLKVISRSAFDLNSVLNTLIQSGAKLCEAPHGVIWLRRGDKLHLAAHVGYDSDWVETAKNNPVTPDPEGSTVSGRVAATGKYLLLEDITADERFMANELHRMGQYRAALMIPLIRDGKVEGTIGFTRLTKGRFTQRQIELVETFADQAVIAIENARLFDEVQAKTRELSEALTYQTGSSNILSVIASSPTDVGPVLRAIVESACELCEADDALVVLKDGEDLVFKAQHGSIPVVWQRQPVSRNYISGRAVVDRKPVHVHDLLAPEGEEFPDAREFARRTNVRTVLSVPLSQENESIGSIVLRRTDVRPFSDKQIALLQTFADQAVIAIGNVRLFEEVQAKTRDLTEALTYQTGSGNILRVIASSPTDVGPVLNAIVESACELCEAVDAIVLLKDGDNMRHGAHHGPIAFALEKSPINRNWAAGRAFLDRKPVHVHDIFSAEGDEFPDTRQRAAHTGTRSLLCVPLLREGESIGTIALRRTEVQPFSEKQIALLQTFADQAVIAIGNVRLFEEVQAKTRDLTESLQQQTATADVLKVISRSTFDLPAVLQTLVESAARLCDADKTNITREKSGAFYRAEAYGFSPEFQEYVKDVPIEAGRGSSFGRALLEGRVIHIPDVLADSEYTYLEGQRLGDYRTVLTVPMLRETVPIGVLSLTRTEVRPFTDKQIELATTFADQAAIAIENVRLFESVESRTRELAKSLEELRTAQDRLVQTEKLASLGQLTAGIAHEIKNPLNFVNNFSALSAELTDELNDVLKPAALNDKLRHEVDELTRLLKDNLEKVVQHGKRADSIVKNMLLHSREGSGEHRPTDINALLDESLNLAYHGARAEKREFNVTLQRDFDEMAGAVDLFPQEITRAFLNLISNGFYAANKRKREVGSGFEPVLHATTRDLGDAVEIRIRDNGIGIPAEVKEKMFNPFFTTKPAGEGTGLGLSMSHDIIVKQHGGTIDVDTEPGEYTEFRIVLPRTSNIANKTRGQT
jgi:GAF domain-containing protein